MTSLAEMLLPAPGLWQLWFCLSWSMEVSCQLRSIGLPSWYRWCMQWKMHGNYWRYIINWISDTMKCPMHYLFTLILLCVVNRREAWVSSQIISTKAQLRAPLSLPANSPGPVSTLSCIIVGHLFAGESGALWSIKCHIDTFRRCMQIEKKKSNIWLLGFWLVCESVWLPHKNWNGTEAG